jgi:sortase (surface protein transpeptidase)
VPGVIHAPYIGDRKVVEGVSTAGVMNLSQFDAGVIHMPGTSNLCATGNAVLGAHRTTSPKPFYSLNLLTPGMTMTASQNGVSCTYQVVDAHVDYVGTSSAASAAVQDVMSQSARFGSDHRLTLFACSQPNGLPTSTSYRLVVLLVPI